MDISTELKPKIESIKPGDIVEFLTEKQFLDGPCTGKVEKKFYNKVLFRFGAIEHTFELEKLDLVQVITYKSGKVKWLLS